MKRRQGIVQAGHRAAKEALPDADGVTHPEGNTDRCVNASGGLVRRGRRTQHAQTLLVREPGYLDADRRWCAPPARAGKATRPKPAMNGDEKSDPAIVAARPANEPGQPGKERVERRAGAEGNAVDPRGVRAQDRAASSLGIDRVRKTAQERKGERFTTLLHHIDAPLLQQAYYWLKQDAAPGVDGMTWEAYGHGLEARLCDLESRVHRGSYRAQPSLRAYIPKPDGGSARSASPRWKTRSSSARWSRFSTLSTRRTSSTSPMGFGPDGDSMMRWTRLWWASRTGR